jgi:hypothetical protein
MQKKIILKHIAMNPDFAIVGDMAVKLTYVQENDETPRIQMFENTQEAIDKERTCYWPEWWRVVTFDEIGDTTKIKIGNKFYEIKFLRLRKDKEEYAKWTEEVMAYEFLVTVID